MHDEQTTMHPKMRRRLRKCVLLTLILAGVSSISRAQSLEPLLLRDPAVSKSQVAFSYAGSIWVANRDGSNVRRLTSGGHEEKPSFSPDGSQVAFTGDYDGTHGVFVVSAAGGEPRRLTYHPADADVQGWTPDGKRILFSSFRTAFASGVIQLFTVPPGKRFCNPGSPGQSCGRFHFPRRRAHRLRAHPAMAVGLETLSRRADQTDLDR